MERVERGGIAERDRVEKVPVFDERAVRHGCPDEG